MSEWPGAADFLAWVDRTYRRRVCANVRVHYPGLSRQDLEDVWAETLKCLFERGPDQIRGGRGLGSLLRTISSRRACDRLRRMNTQQNLIDVRAKEVEAKAASEERGGTRWWDRLDRLEQAELKSQVNEAFRLLSPDEWLVMAVYCEHYPTIRSPGRLLAVLGEEVPEVHHKAWTLADVTRLLDRARKTVQDHLCEKGYRRDFGT